MFTSEDDETDFSIASSSNKLASLFEADHTLMHSGNQSLMYTAPKQPKKPQSPAKDAPHPESNTGGVQSLHATVVTAYKYDGSKYTEQGRLGAAVVGNRATYTYRLLIFKGKQQAVTAASISSTFLYTVQSNNYATFYDDNRQNWSINFDSEANSIEFAKQVALAKFNSCGPANEKITVQDLICSDGISIKEDDNLCLQFCGTIIENQRFGKEFDGNFNAEQPAVLKLSDHNIIKGWEEGARGLKIGGSRIILIPACLAFGNKGVEGKVPPNCPVAIEMKVPSIQMQQAEEPKFERTTSPEQASSSADDGSIKARVASISEQLSHNTKTDKKAKIISRMAKMGQPMLPLRGTISARPNSESETEEEVSGEGRGRSSPKDSSPEPRHRPAPRPRPRATSPPHTQNVQQLPHQGIPTYQMTTYPQQQPQVALGLMGQPQMMQPYSLMPQPSFQTQAFSPGTGLDAHVPMLMAEVRTQNVELRMSVGKVSDKLDNVIGKLDRMSAGREQHATLPTMGTELLARSIQKIVEDNEQMRGELAEKNTKLELQSEKISDLILKNQKFFEQSNSMFFQQSESLQMSTVHSQNRILQLEQEKTKLTLEMTELKAQLAVNVNQEMMLNEKLKSLQNISDGSGSELKELRQRISDLEMKDGATLKLVSDERQRWKQLQTIANQSEERIVSLQSDKENLERRINELAHNSTEDIAKCILEKESLENVHKELLGVLRARIHDLESTVDQNIKTSTVTSNETGDYEERTRQLTEQIATLRNENQQLKSKLMNVERTVDSSNMEVSSLRLQLADTQKSAKDTVELYEEKLASYAKLESEKSISTDVVAQIKKVMNGVYSALRREFYVDESYEGVEIQKILLATIRDVTLQLLEKQESQSVPGSAADEETVKPEETATETQPEVPSSSEPQDTSQEIVEEDAPQDLQIPQEAITLPKTEEIDASEARNTFVADESWKPQPPPLFDELLDEDDDDWLK